MCHHYEPAEEWEAIHEAELASESDEPDTEREREEAEEPTVPAADD